MKTISRLLGVFLLGALLFGAMPARISYADRNAPPDETVQDSNKTAEIEAELKKLQDEKAARERREAEQRRRAAEAKKRAEAQRAEAERKRLEEERRLAAERAVTEALQRGVAFVQDGRYQTGLKALRDFAKEHPYSPEAWYWIARAHHALGDYDRAQQATNIALEIDPYYAPLTKTPSGLQPQPRLTKQQKKEPRPSMSVLPVRPTLPANLALEPVTISFPILREGAHQSDREAPDYDGYDPVTGAYLDYLPYPPMQPGRTVVWQQNEKFTEISRWRFRVDRMGILTDPRVPVAWKGGRPYEVYFWTGTEWARVRRQRVYFDHKEAFDDTLAHAQESIREVLDSRGYGWNEGDTPALAASASHMRFMWIGDIDLTAAHKRAEKRAREHFVYDSWDAISDDLRRGGGEGRERSGSSSGGSSGGGACGNSESPDDYY